MENIGFIDQCRLNFFSKITPANKSIRDHPYFQKTIEIAKNYFKSGKLDDFLAYLQEDHYFVQLWTAHLVLEFAGALEETNKICLNEIKKYADNPVYPEVAIEEQEWLKNYEIAKGK